MDVDGVTVSLKDHFDIAGTQLTQGYVAYLGLVLSRFRLPGPVSIARFAHQRLYAFEDAFLRGIVRWWYCSAIPAQSSTAAQTSLRL